MSLQQTGGQHLMAALRCVICCPLFYFKKGVNVNGYGI